MANDIRSTILDYFLDASLQDCAGALDLINLVMARRRRTGGVGVTVPVSVVRAPHAPRPPRDPNAPRRRRRTPEEMEAAGARRRTVQPAAGQAQAQAQALPDQYVPFEEREVEPVGN